MRRETKAIDNLFLFFIIFGDALLIILAFYLSFLIRFYNPLFTKIIPPIKGIPPWNEYFIAALMIAPIWVLIFYYNGLYENRTLSSLDELLTLIKSITIAMIFTLSFTFFYRGFEYSRLVVLIVWVILILLIYSWHQILKLLKNSIVLKFGYRRKVLIIGNENEVRMIKSHIRNNPTYEKHFMLTFDQEKIKKHVKKRKTDEIIIFQQIVSSKDLIDLSLFCYENKIKLKLVPEILELRRGEIIMDDSLGLPIYEIKPLSFHPSNFYLKRLFDTVFSTLFLSFFSVPLAYIAYLVKLTSPGPIIYRQKRVGYMGREFNFLKFRTMITDADKILEKIRSKSERKGPVFKMKNDPRVTKFGKFLRRFSLDEIPQFFNVLRGEMSLVGPRPQVVWEAQSYDEHAKRRLNVLPGITGLWQISGRAALSFDEMIRLDIWYIENWSLSLDIKILFKTIFAILSKKGAY